MVPEVTDQAATVKVVTVPVGMADMVPLEDRTMVMVMVVTKLKVATEAMAAVSKEVVVPLEDTVEEDIRDATL